MRLASLLLVACILPVTAQQRWLVISGSSRSATEAIKLTAKLRALEPDASVVMSSDCENLRQGLYLSSAAVTTDRAVAQSALEKAKTIAQDSYLRECKARPASRIALNVPAIDPSIEKVPDNAVNWTDEDRTSTVTKLPSGYLWLRRTYVAAPEDPQEGRRTAAWFFTANPADALQLTADCSDTGHAQNGTRLALSCARESAGDNLFHEITVYDTSTGQPLRQIKHCRKPNLPTANQLACQAEEVDAQGTLHLRPKQVEISGK
jgi:hypothetical protein